MTNVTPETYYDALQNLLCELFGHDWHLGYWLNASTMAEAGQRLNEVMAARLPAGSGLSVLDVGCGVGGGTCFLAAHQSSRVVGVSNSRPGLAEALRFAQARHVDHLVTFEFGEMQKLPFPDASFDAVWSCEAIHNVADKAPVVSEIARVLKPGGTALLGDLFLVDQTPSPEDADRLRQFSFHLCSADDLIALLQEHGLRVHESIDIGHHVGPRSPETSAEVCRQKLLQTTGQTMERTILERTIMATAFLAEQFRARKIGWGIWTARKS